MALVHQKGRDKRPASRLGDPQPDICISAGCPYAAPAARWCRLALEELRSVLAGRAEVSFAAGIGIGTTDNDEELLQEAVELANGADHVLVFLGLPGEDESEGLAELVAEL
jgi:hypothetical protein